jgi:SAM-dependent methyltransferase
MKNVVQRARALARKLVRRSWMRYALRGVGGSDNHARLDLAYSVPDPWNLESKGELERFEGTNRIALGAFGHVGSLLELGCGEGHQSAHFARISDRVHGVDVSGTAVERARKRMPGGEFAVADVFGQPWGDAKGRFDLVTACEMLYYLKDPAGTIARMRHLGKACLVTVYSPGLCRLGPLLDGIEGVRKDWLYYGDTTWLVWWWRNG